MAGEDKVIELVLDKIWELKSVGVQMMIVGHTKRKNQSDVATGEEYETLTANLTNRYFNAIKTKLHILGVASIDRSIEKQRIKQKVGADKVVGKVTSESRIITFRDDNFNIDSKSRFNEITPQIDLDVDQFIAAIEDAIKKAHNKQSGAKSIEETKKEQEQVKEEAIEKAVEEKTHSKVNVEENVKLTEEIRTGFGSASDDTKVKVKEVMAKYGITSLKDTDETPTEALRQIAKLLK
jgi:hypothetical protein